MGTTLDYAEFVCEQIQGVGYVRFRKMFGEYMIYVDDKPILLVCDNTVYIKKHEALQTLMVDADCGFPYQGAKEHYILDIEDVALSRQAIEILLPITPLPKPKKKKSAN